MSIIKTPINDLLIFEPKVFHDDRGYFTETYNEKTLNNLGLETKFIQDNQSFSS
ncbi:MAG: dTDP-4-dehydrorhamnose 3,5-epimerase family protein, partial [Bacteriovoracaceae bacterium]|nr:dTDP-4-dehydrorhamnose 3,5-epimerase family protein [Bacteriovoracaceae bacterium]